MDSTSIITSILNNLIQDALPESENDSQPDGEEVPPPTDVEMPHDPVKDQPSMAGRKRQHSRSHLQSIPSQQRSAAEYISTPGKSAGRYRPTAISGAMANTTLPETSPEFLPLPPELENDFSLGEKTDMSLVLILVMLPPWKNY